MAKQIGFTAPKRNLKEACDECFTTEDIVALIEENTKHEVLVVDAFENIKLFMAEEI